jgi:hypothetical protein
MDLHPKNFHDTENVAIKYSMCFGAMTEKQKDTDSHSVMPRCTDATAQQCIGGIFVTLGVRLSAGLQNLVTSVQVSQMQNQSCRQTRAPQNKNLANSYQSAMA